MTTLIWFALVQSSPPVELTEPETEYSVNVVKHIYPGYIVFQFNCTNTISEQLLENVSSWTSILLVSLIVTISWTMYLSFWLHQSF